MELELEVEHKEFDLDRGRLVDDDPLREEAVVDDAELEDEQVENTSSNSSFSLGNES